MDLDHALRVSAAGLQAQSTRLRIVAENLANKDSTGSAPGADPYRRKTVTFGAHVERGLAAGGNGGVSTVKVSRVGTAPGAFNETYDPAHPAADFLALQTQLIDQHGAGARLLDGVEVLTGHVLDERRLQARGLVLVADHDGDLREAGPGGGAPAPLAGDQLVGPVGELADDQRLDDAGGGDRAACKYPG